MTRSRLRQPDLLAVGVLAPICLLICLLVPAVPVRAIAVVPLCLVFPGYTLQSLIFARSRLELPMKLALSVGLSLASLVLGALVLNYVPGGLREATWSVLLLVVIELEAGAAMVRRADFNLTRLGPGPGRPSPRMIVNTVLTLIAVAIAVGAFWATRRPLDAPNSNGYEQLSVAPLRGDRGVRLDVVSARQYTESYRLSVTVAGRPVLTRTLRLAPGDGRSITVVVGPSGRPRRVLASVVMLGGAFSPRQVNLQLPAAG